MQKALFLDRDGVINVDHGYVFRADDFDFIPGVFEACKAFQKAGFTIVVVTNQAGVARGYYTEEDVQALHRWMCERFANEGVDIKAVYYCPHHQNHGEGDYRRHCAWRKPEPGMLLTAKTAFNLNMSASIMLGDKVSDMQAALAAGVGTRVFIGEHSQQPQEATHCAASLTAFAAVSGYQ